MLDWFHENLGTIVVMLVLAAVLTAVIVYLIREKRSGKGGCGGGCQHCAMYGQCHGKKQA